MKLREDDISYLISSIPVVIVTAMLLIFAWAVERCN